MYFYKELENVGGAPRGDVPTTSRPGSLIEAGEKFYFFVLEELVPSANGFLNRQTKGTMNAENIGTNLKLWFIVHLIAHEY